MGRRVQTCLDCGWRIRDDEHENASALMIQHAIETGHDLTTVVEKNGEVFDYVDRRYRSVAGR